jgi:hypothetical protein
MGIRLQMTPHLFRLMSPEDQELCRQVYGQTIAQQDGKKTDMYGVDPQGQEMFDPNGRFSLVLIRSNVPKFASNNREQGTTEENQTAVRGSIAYFGTYSVSETDKVITYHIEGSTFPNWRGADQKRLFKISGDELTLTNPGTPSVGSGKASAVFKRAK